MVNITLQFTVFDDNGQRCYKPSSGLTQIFCGAHNFEFASQKDIDNLHQKGYEVLIEEEETLCTLSID